MQHLSEKVSEQARQTVIAHRRIRPWLSPTPLIASRVAFNDDSSLWFKAENLQRTGSFKYRGALSKLSAFPTETPIVTASSGNHGLACARAAQITGHRLCVVLPENVARQKMDKIQALGVETLFHSEDAGEAERYAQDLAATRGQVYVSPYNDPAVIAGQGTIALELLEQAAHVDVVYVSLGGGGLVSGIGATLKAFSPETRIVGVSAANSAALASSIRAGKAVEVTHAPTLADGCAGGIDPEAITIDLASAVIDDLMEIDEVAIEDALRWMAWEENMLVEGSAALALAAWHRDRERNRGKTSVVILCGANFDRSTILPIISKAR